MNTIRLKKGRERSVVKGHPWVFSGAIAEGEAAAGEMVEVCDASGAKLGQGHFLHFLQLLLTGLDIPHVCGSVWSTDAFYRETPSAVKMMKEQQCLCVDMECAANMAVAQFRGVQCFQMMFSADRMESNRWDIGSMRSMGADMYEKFAETAVRVALS